MNIQEFKAILDGVGCPVARSEGYQEEIPYIVYEQADETRISGEIQALKVFLYTKNEDSEEFKSLKRILLDNGISYLFKLSYDIKTSIYKYETEVVLWGDSCTLIKYDYVFDEIGNHIPHTMTETVVGCNIVKISNGSVERDYSTYKPKEIVLQIQKNSYTNQQYIKYDKTLYVVNSVSIAYANISQYKLPLMEVVAVNEVT